MRRGLGVVTPLVFAAAVAAGTVLAGWWAVPALSAVWVRAIPSLVRPVRSSMTGAVLGWGALLGWTAFRVPAGLLTRRVGGLLGLPGWGFVVITLVFAAALAGAAARVVRPVPPR